MRRFRIQLRKAPPTRKLFNFINIRRRLNIRKLDSSLPTKMTINIEATAKNERKIAYFI